MTEDGVRIHYRLAGAGEPALVFVHGWCSNLTHWDAQVRHFAKHHRVLAVDRRGHGRSDAPDDGYTAAQHATDLAHVLREVGIEDAVIVGHAGGCPATMAFAQARPELARAIVLVDTFIGPRASLGRDVDGSRSGLGAMVHQLDTEHGSVAFEAMYRGFFSSHAGVAADRAVHDAMKVPLDIARAELASLAISTQAIARSLTQPVLWISVEQADEARLAKVFRDVQFGRVVGSGHFPQIEVPDQVNAMIDRFLAVQKGFAEPGEA